ncbi:adenosylcobinamide-phosphate synthase CbiB [Vibrio sp. WJH972]
MMTLGLIIFAYLLDRFIGDPPSWPHPIRWIGSLISKLERWIRSRCHTERHLYIGGFVLWFVTVGLTWSATWLLIVFSYQVTIWFGVVVQIWLALTVLASRSLNDAAIEVYQALKYGSLEESRTKLSYIVGRDTTNLDRKQIQRAVVETVAENTVDGVIAPLFYLFIGGIPLAMAYKAVNTLDSMVGYKNDKYAQMGFVSAKVDDVANWLPARLSYFFLSLAAYSMKLDYSAALKVGYRDRNNHKSPNCAWSEGAVAGALGVRLGGPNVYFGQTVEKPWIGDGCRDIDIEDIRTTNQLMYRSSTVALGAFALVLLIVTYLCS